LVVAETISSIFMDFTAYKLIFFFNNYEIGNLFCRYIAGRISLAQIFLQYDIEIRKVAADANAARKQQVGTEHILRFSSSASDSHSSQSNPSEMSPSSGGDKSSKKHDRVARLKAAVRDYGSIVIVFHVGIALTSLGFFYTLVAR